ncbi:MAG TPA: enoyl-CoA hydratase [Acidimicrobiales bacterium]|nr:enoyl-CoA hydratase [Acidimicrobiales bacterium]
MAETDDILIDRAEGVVTLTLNRPERKNAVTTAMWTQLREVFIEVAENPEDRVLVVTGAGGAFCSGADLSGVGDIASGGLTRMRTVGAAAQALHDLPKPTIAKVPGVAAGAGANLALGCDLIVASDEARFSEIFSARGLSLDFGGSWLLPRLIGLHRAKELAFFADILSAKEAQDFGLVNRVVPSSDLDSLVDEWAARLAAGPPIALSMTKRMLNNASTSTLGESLEAEALSQVVNFKTEDLGEAMRAFAEKRPPNFRGR